MKENKVGKWLAKNRSKVLTGMIALSIILGSAILYNVDDKNSGASPKKEMENKSQKEVQEKELANKNGNVQDSSEKKKGEKLVSEKSKDTSVQASAENPADQTKPYSNISSVGNTHNTLDSNSRTQNNEVVIRSSATADSVPQINNNIKGKKRMM